MQCPHLLDQLIEPQMQRHLEKIDLPASDRGLGQPGHEQIDLGPQRIAQCLQRGLSPPAGQDQFIPRPNAVLASNQWIRNSSVVDR